MTTRGEKKEPIGRLKHMLQDFGFLLAAYGLNIPGLLEEAPRLLPIIEAEANQAFLQGKEKRDVSFQLMQQLLFIRGLSQPHEYITHEAPTPLRMLLNYNFWRQSVVSSIDRLIAKKGLDSLERAIAVKQLIDEGLISPELNLRRLWHGYDTSSDNKFFPRELIVPVLKMMGLLSKDAWERFKTKEANRNLFRIIQVKARDETDKNMVEYKKDSTHYIGFSITLASIPGVQLRIIWTDEEMSIVTDPDGLPTFKEGDTGLIFYFEPKALANLTPPPVEPKIN